MTAGVEKCAVDKMSQLGDLVFWESQNLGVALCEVAVSSPTEYGSYAPGGSFAFKQLTMLLQSKWSVS